MSEDMALLSGDLELLRFITFFILSAPICRAFTPLLLLPILASLWLLTSYCPADGSSLPNFEVEYEPVISFLLVLLFCLFPTVGGYLLFPDCNLVVLFEVRVVYAVKLLGGLFSMLLPLFIRFVVEDLASC